MNTNTSIGADDDEGSDDGDDDNRETTICLTQIIYSPCTFHDGGQVCDSKPCLSAEVDLEMGRVNLCLQSVLDAYNHNNTSQLDVFMHQPPMNNAEKDHLVARTTTFNATSRQDLPFLPLYGETTTCTAQSYDSILIDDAQQQQPYQSEKILLAFFGVALLFCGVGTLLVQAVVDYLDVTQELTEEESSIEDEDEDEGGDTECCSSVASSLENHDDEELGQKKEDDEHAHAAAEEEFAAAAAPEANKDGDVTTTSSSQSGKERQQESSPKVSRKECQVHNLDES